jgi:hypothetical protein
MPPIKRIELVVYTPARCITKSDTQKSLDVIGIDTEALSTGRCFMICTSERDIIDPAHFPQALFNRQYIGRKFVAYNLKYENGAFVQALPKYKLKELQLHGKTEYNGFRYRVIGDKCLIITRGKNSITFYDIAKFYEMKLDNAAYLYLHRRKIEIGSKTFTPENVKHNFSKIAKYCIRDAELARDLTTNIVASFEKLDIYPKKLYSPAYISWEYVKQRCKWINVKRWWYGRRELLDYAMQSYNGGKFEVTQKGSGYYYEYDIVSAYPYEISNLVDISDARLEQSKNYIQDATYGFLKCRIIIPYNVHSPVALKKKNLNYYPVGEYEKVITKGEYDYLIKYGADIEIIKGLWLYVDKVEYPYRAAILELMKLKDKYKHEKNLSMYNLTKRILNSIYGKLVQLIWTGKYYRAGSSWNPIFGSIITSNVRIRVSELQQRYDSIKAVHTDSVISTTPLPYATKGSLGDMVLEDEGNGIILGSGIYQICIKTKLRGFNSPKTLKQLMPSHGTVIPISSVRPYSWKEVIHLGLDKDKINRFMSRTRNANLNFDTKRIWLNDYHDMSEVLQRNVESLPWTVDLLQYSQ